MTDYEQLEQAIAALEGQRVLLGDAVVDAALAPMREKLALLDEQAAAGGQQRKQVTLLFADIVGSTDIGRQLADPETIIEVMDGGLERMAEPVRKQGGHITRFTGDGFKAVFGFPVAHEDDAERAVRAGLDILAVVRAYAQELDTRRHVHGFDVRVGINTGLVATGGFSEGEDTVMGLAVNLGARMESACPPGNVLISRYTYQHVRGIFDVEALPPVTCKGFAEPVPVYLVERAKPQAFRMHTRGVEGTETRMVGREAELLALQSAFADALEGGETRMMMVMGEAGVGKSRLLFEFETWMARQGERVCCLKGRTTPSRQQVPYSVVRDMLAKRFEILESDSASVALRKFRAGMADHLAAERADLVGYLIGFDFSSSPAVRRLIGSPGFAELARVYLTGYMRELARREPVVIFLEDLHWADDSSLDLIVHWLAEIPHARLLLVGLARPELFERRPHWCEGLPALVRLDLKLLSLRASRALVGEILQKVDVVPDALRDLIVEGAEGNPFYVEELVKMLIEEGVIEPRSGARQEWRIDQIRLDQVRVPSTLTGILQARLDSLPRSERELLQRAAVVGRLFWDEAVADLAPAGQEPVGDELSILRARELVFQRERSAFAGTQEYVFKHALLRDVTYETVLLKLRPGYHARVARWLEAHAGERIGEYAGVIAEHLERAGEPEQAAKYLCEAGAKLLETGALRASLTFSRRALALLPAESPERARLLIQAGEALLGLSEYAEARQVLEAGLSLAQAVGDEGNCAAAFDHLGGIARDQGNWGVAIAQLESSLALARTIGDPSRVAHILWSLGWVYIGQGALEEARTSLLESQALYQGLGDRLGVAQVLNGLGSVALGRGIYEDARALFLEGMALFRESGDRLREAITLANLGETARLQGDCAAAGIAYEEALAIFQEIGQKLNVALTVDNLGHVASALGNDAAAFSRYYEALRITHGIGATPLTLDSLAGLAGVLARTGQPARSLDLLGLVTVHPALLGDTKPVVTRALADLHARLPAEVVAAGLERGSRLDLETVVTEVLEASACG
jgi:class 3 adenylate cyclase/tetratricopeptide (TPR) repeat protein